MKSQQTRTIQSSRFWATVLACLSILTTITVQTSQGAGLLIAEGGFGGKLEIIEHEVSVTINNGIAVTNVTQIFENKEQRQVEALYTFPVPKGASVSNFSMWINGKEMIGEVLEKKRARTIYNSYKAKRRDPGLLEQTSYKTFEMRIFPIAARAKQKIQITYYQELNFDHDRATYVYPLATTSKNNPDSHVQGKFAVSVDVKSAIPIVSLESPSHNQDILVVEHSQDYFEASLENRNGDLARDIVLSFQTKRPVSGLDLLTSKTGKEDGFFMITLTAGDELKQTKTGSDYVFVLDISGSMANGGKLTTSRNSIDAFVTSLVPEDRFEVITFNRQANPLFSTLTSATKPSLDRARSFLLSQDAKGGTSLQPALNSAYKYSDPDRPLNVVIVSDGITDQADRNILMGLIRNRPANVKVFCIGVGNDINRPLLQQMAKDAGGLAAFISKGDDFKRQAMAFHRKLSHPAATDLQLKVTGVELYETEPSVLPNLFHGMPVRVYGRYRNGGKAEVTLAGEVNGKPFATTSSITFPKEDNSSPQIERMWAYKRMRIIQDQMKSKNDQGAIDEIVRLGEAFSITSEYTSFIVLENNNEYKRWNIERRNALRIERDRKAQQTLRAELEKIRTSAAQGLGPAAAKNNIKPTQMAQSTTPRTIKQQQQPAAQPSPRPLPQNRNNGFDMPSFGGGAMDPFSALLAIGLTGMAALGRRKK